MCSLSLGFCFLSLNIFHLICSHNKIPVALQLLCAVKQSHENGVCHGKLSYEIKLLLL